MQWRFYFTVLSFFLRETVLSFFYEIRIRFRENRYRFHFREENMKPEIIEASSHPYEMTWQEPSRTPH
jgi:hypothetical protein